MVFEGMAVKRPVDDLALATPLKAPKLEPSDDVVGARESHSVPHTYPLFASSALLVW